MKKFGIFACAALATLCTARLSAAVESDIVGYTKVTTIAGFNMMGATFVALNENSQTLNDIISGEFTDGDEIQVYDKTAGGYVIYSYETGSGWLDENYELATATILPGTAFWLKTPGRSIEVTFAGKVATGDYVYEGKAGFQMVAVGLPVDIDLNKVAWTGLVDGDEIQVRNGNTYIIYSYENGTGWLDENYEVATTKIPAGASIWLKAKNNGVKMTVKAVL